MKNLVFGKYRIDALQMVSYEFLCEPDKCVEKGEYCCAKFEVDVSKIEMERLAGLVPVAAKYSGDLLDSDGSLLNVFDESDDDPGRFSIEKNDEGDCIFTYSAGNSNKRCSAHTACLDMGVDPTNVKPLSCSIWPLTLCDEDEDGTVEVSLDLYNDPVCLSNKESNIREVSENVKELLAGLFGKETGQVVELIEEIAKQ